MISKEEVEKIAKLSRLELSEKEVEKMQKDLSEILNYFDVLKSAPKVKTTNHSLQTTNLRIDEAKDSKVADKLINASPDKKDGYIKVKAIF